MPPIVRAVNAAAVAALVVAAPFGPVAIASPVEHAVKHRPWMNAADPVSVRVQKLLGEMTLDEKVAQLIQVWGTVKDTDIERLYGNTSVGAMYSSHLSANDTCNSIVRCRTEARNALQQSVMKSSRLRIPITFVSETLHSPMLRGGRRGRRSEGAPTPRPTPPDDHGTTFPMPMTQGTTWNRSLVTEIAAAIAREARAAGNDRGFSPELQVVTDPRFGRGQENFGADPYLVSEMGVAALAGLQGDATGGPDQYLTSTTTQVTAEAKHFCAYGFGNADGSPADVSLYTLYNVYLRPWRAFVKAGGRAVMVSHNSLNAIPMHSNAWALTDVLRGDLGCEHCLVATDFRDVQLLEDFNTANTTRYPGLPPDTDASVQAVSAGVDQDLGGYSFPSLAQAVRAGLVNETYIDRAAANVLRAKFAAGLFDSPMTPLSLLDELDSQAHRDLARRAAAEGAVLLINNKPHAASTASSRGGSTDGAPRNADATGADTRPVLPLRLGGDGGAKSVAVIGPNADDAMALGGGYFPDPAPGQFVTTLAAFRVRAPHGTTILYEPGVPAIGGDTSGVAAAVNATRAADVAVIVLGDSQATCGESEDRVELDLPGHQLELLSAVLAVGKPVAVVLVHGRPVTFGGEHNSRFGGDNAMLSSPNLAVVAVGRPGEDGGNAVYDVLTGLVNPSGRTTTVWPKSAGYVHSRAVPYLALHQGDYDWNGPWALVDDPWTPLACFGAGMSYSNFTLDAVTLKSGVAAPDGVFDATVAVSEHSEFAPAGRVVVQVYASQVTASRSGTVRYERWLAAFGKFDVAPGARGLDVPLAVSADDLGYDVVDMRRGGAHGWRVEDGEYRLFFCLSSCDCPLNATVIVSASAGGK